MVGERFMKSVFERISMTWGCSRVASGIASSIGAVTSFFGGFSRPSGLEGRCGGYTHSGFFRRRQLPHGISRSHFCLDFLHEVQALGRISACWAH